MNVHIITSSYPAHSDDPEGTAGLFVREFALELCRQGQRVIVQPVARKKFYRPDPPLIIEPIPWRGCDQELASMSLINPGNWWTFLRFFSEGRKKVLETARIHKVDRTLCMWAIPSGIFGFWIKNELKIPYDVWALGSDIWKIRKIPCFGPWLLRKIIKNADRVFADGTGLCKEVTSITKTGCVFLPSCRKLPSPQGNLPPLKPENAVHLLFVGRYHYNKGPDLLFKSLHLLSKEIKGRIHLHMFGVGPLENKLKKMIVDFQLQELVSFNGPIGAQDLSDYLKKVSFLVIPSRIESIPVIFSDAMQIGTPVITTPVGDLPDLVNRFQCGILSKGVTPPEFAEAIKEIIQKKEESFHQRVLGEIEEFNISSVAKRWLSAAMP